MTVRPVLRVPDPVLKARARALAAEELALAEQVAADLLDTMRAHPRCVGLAAPQIGELVRMVVVDCTDHPRAPDAAGLLLLVNPEIVERDGEEVAREGCLSIPELTANVRRSVSIAVEALTPDGEPIALRSQGFEARCIQHELDHLDGILFLDRVDSLRRDVFRRKSYG
ncbi:MAG: peptide deformylase [Gaiellaceae bacterium]|jgi:peptide deformylase|nr:peptide deformylase [Gaiellaceae bacterium]